MDWTMNYMGPWKQACSCTSSGVAAGPPCLRGTFSVHQNHLFLPGPTPTVTGHRTGWAAFDSTSPVALLCAALWAGKELGWWTACPCLMTMASWGVPAAVYPCLTYKDVPAGPWRGALASSWSGNSGTCSTAAAEAEASLEVCSLSGLMRTLMDLGGCSVWLGINGFKYPRCVQNLHLKNYLQQVRLSSPAVLGCLLLVLGSACGSLSCHRPHFDQLPCLSSYMKSLSYRQWDSQSLVGSLPPHLAPWFCSWIPALSPFSGGIDFSLFKYS